MIDQNETRPSFDMQILVDALKPGERLLEPPARSDNDLRDTYGYEIYPIKDETGEEGSSVFLVMEAEGDAVEPVELIGPVTLIISPVAGEGLVIVHTPHKGVSPNLLAADGSRNDGGNIELGQGDSYAYLNMGRVPFVIRDDSRSVENGQPHFDPSYEVSASNPELLTALADLGIKNATD